MKLKYLTTVISVSLALSCTESTKYEPFTSVDIEILYEDSLSIRAIELMGNSLAFAANKGVFGNIDLRTGKVRTNTEKYHTFIPEFRAVAHTASDFFMLSVADPALLYKTGDGGMELVYKEEGDEVFYDAMTFWNDQEGIAVGDTVEGCLSIIITRDGGYTWNKLSCSQLPKGIAGEGAFAASNSNIAVVGNKTWIATTAARIYFSPDKGETWSIQETPITGAEATQGIYSLAFWDEDLGIAFGGDYTYPEGNSGNKAITKDGGKTWQTIADGQEPGYKSCVQFVPNTGGKGIVALGFTGISYSADMGESWKKLSDEPFFTFRFLNDSIAYAAGNGRIAKLVFK